MTWILDIFREIMPWKFQIFEVISIFPRWEIWKITCTTSWRGLFFEIRKYKSLQVIKFTWIYVRKDPASDLILLRNIHNWGDEISLAAFTILGRRLNSLDKLTTELVQRKIWQPIKFAWWVRIFDPLYKLPVISGCSAIVKQRCLGRILTSPKKTFLTIVGWMIYWATW